MKKILMTVIFLTVISFGINGQTYVSGIIYSNTTWTLANSPYIVVDTVFVYGVTLTIEPGVKVKFENNKLIKSTGSIIASGSITDSITFTSNSILPTSGIYSGIINNGGADTSRFDYCNFQYAEYGIKNYGPLIIKNCIFSKNINGLFSIQSFDTPYVYLDSSEFINNTNYGLYDSFGHIFNTKFISNQIGLFATYSSVLENCTIKSNQIGLKNKIWSSLFLKNCIIDSNLIGINVVAHSGVLNCNIRFNQIGILDSTGQCLISNSIIDSNSIYGIKILGTVLPSKATISNCEIKYNGVGISDTASSAPNVITRNIIESNSIGIELGCSNDNIHCNKICNNIIYDLKYSSSVNANISHNDWCTIDSVSTAALIYDGNDTTSYGVLNFSPLDTNQCYQCNYIFIDISQTNPSCDTCSDASATATAYSGTPPYSYSWNTIPIQNTQTATGLAQGYYSVSVTDSIGCMDSILVYISIYININEANDNLPFLIFPNPAFNNLTLRFVQNTSKAEIKIYNLLGELKSTSINSSSESNLDISNLANGVYIIEVTTEKNIMRQKFLKQ